ncbi:MAG: hypothetical protein IPF62_11720 [Bacteroidetes bacterium]|nr:hypothetical protein [Bacteroidota bacterium]
MSKDKTISRQEAINVSEQNIIEGTAFNADLVQKAMNQIRKCTQKVKLRPMGKW